jgi:hypothetical protein
MLCKEGPCCLLRRTYNERVRVSILLYEQIGIESGRNSYNIGNQVRRWLTRGALVLAQPNHKQTILSTSPLSLQQTTFTASFGSKMNSTDTSNNLEVDSGQTRVLRPRAPVDIEKQCGVALPSGNQCARSLTCSRHSWTAKRTVPGRSAPFDQLLAEYQREK